MCRVRSTVCHVPSLLDDSRASMLRTNARDAARSRAETFPLFGTIRIGNNRTGKPRNARIIIILDAKRFGAIVVDEPFLSAKESNGHISNSAYVAHCIGLGWAAGLLGSQPLQERTCLPYADCPQIGGSCDEGGINPDALFHSERCLKTKGANFWSVAKQKVIMDFGPISTACQVAGGRWRMIHV